MPTSECPECRGAMEAGFVADESYSNVKPSQWYGGVPEPSWISGTKLRGKPRYQLVALRCPRCGYVKLYAHGDEAAAATYAELAERVERLEDELRRMAEREQFLLALLERRGELPGPRGGES